MIRMSSLISLVVRHVFSRNNFLVAFRQMQIWYVSEKVHGWAGWYGQRGGGGLEVCGCRGVRFLILLGARRFKFSSAGRERTNNLNPRRTPLQKHGSTKKIKRWPVMLKLCQPRKHLSCCEDFLAEIPTEVTDIFVIIVPQPITFIILYSSWFTVMIPAQSSAQLTEAGSYQ